MAGRTRDDDRAAADAKPRGRPRDADSHETRATIIATAQLRFGEAGFKGVSMERLARDSGLTVRALYHYFPSKRALFRAATDEALQRFGDEIATRVFVHEHLPDRLRGFIDVYRGLYAHDPQVLAFIGMVLVDAISEDLTAGGRSESETGSDLASASGPVQVLNALLVDDALARSELHPDVDRDGAMHLLEMMGMGLALAAFNDTGSFPTMLDALERLVDGTLLRPPPPG